MQRIKENTSYYINERAVNLVENALGDPSLIQVSLYSGTVVLVYIKGIIDYAYDGGYQRFPLYGYNTALVSNEAHHIYIRIDRSRGTAMLLFSTQEYEFDSDESGQYWYIRCGEVTDAGSGSTPREITFDSGLLSTAEGLEGMLDGRYVSVSYFERIFDVLNGSTSLRTNDLNTAFDSLKVKTGLWTDQYVSALGKNSSGESGGGGGGGATTLGMLEDVDIDGAQPGQALVYQNGTWVPGTISGGITQGQLNAALAPYSLTANTVSALGTSGNSLTWTKNGVTYNVTVPYATKALNDGQGNEIAATYLTKTDAQNTYLSKTDAQNTYLSKTDAQNTYVSIAFFETLFNALNSSGQKVNANTTTGIASIKAMFGFWTEQYLSALGKNSGSGGGSGATTLGMLEDVDIDGAQPGQALVYQNGTWVPGTISGGITQSQLNAALASYSLTANTVSALGTSGNSLTWTKNGVTYNVTVPYATKALNDGQGNEIAATYLTKTDAQNTYVSIAFFETLFNALNSSGQKVNANTTTGIASIKAMFGFWTEQYLSALGKNSGSGGGGGATTLSMLEDVDIDGATVGQVLTYTQVGSTYKWTPTTVGGGGGLDPAAMWAALATSGSEQINASHLSTALSSYVTSTAMTNALSNYLPLTGGTLSGGLTTRTITPASNNTYNLGSSGTKWGTIYTNDIYSNDFTFNNGGWLTVEDGELGYRTSAASGNFKKVLLDGDASISLSTTGNGNAFTSASLSNGTLTLTKGSTFATQSWVNTQLGSYLPLSGGTMTGAITLKGDQYYLDENYSLNMNNSDIIGANCIYFADALNSQTEGLFFPRSSGSNYDMLRIYNGEILFAPNIAKGSTGNTQYNILHTNNYSSVLDDRYVNVTGDIMTGNLNVQKSDGSSTIVSVTNSKGSIGIETTTNRGLWDYTTGVWVVGTNGTQTWLNGGNVGIGNFAGSTVGYKLHVAGNGCFTNYLTLRSDLYIYNAKSIYFKDSDGTDRSVLNFSANNNINIGYGTYSLGAGLYLYGKTFVVRIGGTSATYNALVIDASKNTSFSGNVTASGEVTALSDIRQKSPISDVNTSIADLAGLPIFYFKWKAGHDDNMHIGTSAQAVQKLFPELVLGGEELSVNYGVLGTTLGILNSRKLTEHERRILDLEKENKRLRREINKLKGVTK